MKKILLTVAAISALTFTACSNDDDNTPTTSNLSLNVSGLENLGADYVYEGWIIVGGAPVSTGTFNVNDSGELSQTSFVVDSDMLSSASTFVLSIEPANDSDPAPAATKILAGDFSGSSASITSTGIVGDFSNAAGKYILATPTDGMSNNERSGIWFLDLTGGSPATSLSLPTLSAGWKYEGWVVMNGTPISTGTFTDAAMADDNAATTTFKGDVNDGPAFPGEDYINNAPTGLMFPTDLRGATAVISVEPDPDNSPNPFTLKPLAHGVPADANDHVTYTMGAGPVVQISGTVTR
ncbi:anti-sigma factor [Tenacibaculum tangerinum]|uniref:Anti-sigma factor n=1 Tax=Tenacibaculum tangerinum TaxID=3038772 RepID=A0ABY8L7B7_9FLAO|nr:anti-sigma factor [Tenacibaculum tangerinum]WGH75989.1 anti-sigma factor [Tenacibaculum tangerinum]